MILKSDSEAELRYTDQPLELEQRLKFGVRPYVVSRECRRCTTRLPRSDSSVSPRREPPFLWLRKRLPPDRPENYRE